MSNMKTRAAIVSALALMMALPEAAHAGTDTTFGPVVATVTGWMTGSLGLLLALSATVVGLAGSVMRQSLMPVVTGIAFALALFTVPTVITGIVTATLPEAAAIALPALPAMF